MLGVATANVIATVSPIALTNFLSGIIGIIQRPAEFPLHAAPSRPAATAGTLDEPLGFGGAVAPDDEVQLLGKPIDTAFKVRERRFNPIERHHMEIAMLCLDLCHGGSDQ